MLKFCGVLLSTAGRGGWTGRGAHVPGGNIANGLAGSGGRPSFWKGVAVGVCPPCTCAAWRTVSARPCDASGELSGPAPRST
eukprot:11973834-Alexandrium_andersonii.AAC.1